MAFGSELGSAHISVFPSMRGFRSAVNKEVGASGKAASKTFDSSCLLYTSPSPRDS